MCMLLSKKLKKTRAQAGQELIADQNYGCCKL
jgi:hypothetical protein